jgi:hypothetical protein
MFAPATTFASSSSSRPGEDRPLSLPGFLFRRISPIRVYRHTDQIRSFLDVLGLHQFTSHAEMLTARLRGQIDALDKQGEAARKESGSVSEVSIALSRIGDAKVAATSSYAQNMRREMNAYVETHFAFVGRHHHDAMQYMAYWTDFVLKSPSQVVQGVVSKELVDKLMEHNKTIGEIVKKAMSHLETVIKGIAEAKSVVTGGGGGGAARLTDEQLSEARGHLERLEFFALDRRDELDELYKRGGLTLAQTVLSKRTVVLYALKALRLLTAWATLLVATRTFQDVYRDRVYTRDESPPNPAWFVLMFVVADLAVQAIVVGILAAVRHMLSPGEGSGFPIDGHLITAWLVDVAASTAVIAVISLVIGQVIKHKKYFRYKYEGERGIRAMREMVYYAYCVTVPAPFYRIIGA